jgi:hypothetical protein
MARLRVVPHVADQVLNHTWGTIRGVAAVYNRFQYLDDRGATLDTLGGSSRIAAAGDGPAQRRGITGVEADGSPPLQ